MNPIKEKEKKHSQSGIRCNGMGVNVNDHSCHFRKAPARYLAETWYIDDKHYRDLGFFHLEMSVKHPSIGFMPLCAVAMTESTPPR